MFGRIAHRYDFANLLLSGGFCIAWTRRLAREAAAQLRSPNALAVDLATGSGDVVFALAKRAQNAHIRGFDFCQPMLEEARKRLALAQKGSHEIPQNTPPSAETAPLDALGRVSFEFGDCMALPLGDGLADVVTIAYGVRNFQDRARGLREILRVLRPRASAFILEFSQPAPWFRPFYYFYVRKILPLLARIATGDRNAYEYLGGSIAAFPAREKFAEELRAAGFCEVRAIPLTFGIVAIHHAQKPA